MSIVRDYNGFVDLDKWNIKHRQILNIFNSFTFVKHNQRYYFKELKNTKDCYNELIGYELACQFGLNAVPYDIASYDGFVGYLSEDYMKEGYVYLEKILESTYNNTRDKNNLDCATIALKNYFPEQVALRISDELLDLLMFDVIIANYDRHDRNILIDTKNGCLGPVSDNEMMLNEDSMYDQYFSFSMFEGDRYTVDNLLSYLDLEQLNYFASKVELIKEDNIRNIIKTIEIKLGAPLIEALKEDILKKFKSHYAYLLRMIKKELEERKKLSKK